MKKIFFNRVRVKLPPNKGWYEFKLKPMFDKWLSFAGMVFLAPVYGVISLAIFIDDPGPVIFTQKRVGKGRQFFLLHKFRSMKMDTPHDVPTHLLSDPDQYITRVGRILRKTSLDELPQMWDIFAGNMSIIGPRPALWNQEDLVEEREKYGANDVKPGLTGWAQINGRDELNISDKAKFDGEYVKRLRQGGANALLFDIKCFAGTIMGVLKGAGVVEGGTGASGGRNAVRADVGFEDYGFRKNFNINRTAPKKVLITGAGSYVGESFKRYVKKYYPNISVSTIDMLDGSWKKADFTGYDSVFHVAGIAHTDIGNVGLRQQKQYYEVNTDLAIETCKKAGESGVKQFIFMSSMIIYGDSAPFGKEKIIEEHTVPSPSNFYGDSKWQADKGVRKLKRPGFNVAVLRAPMIYGKGSRGNYGVLSRMTKRLPVFPEVHNERSMIYIENLCEFISLLILSGEGGIYFPQNAEYTNTAEMVKEISEVSGRPIYMTGVLKFFVSLAGKVPGKIGNLVNKAFGNSIYDRKLSQYPGLEYQKVSLKESLARTEGIKKTVLILVNHDVVIYNFRLELVERLLAEGYEVHISSPVGEHTEELKSLGVYFHKLAINRHGMNPVDEWKLLMEYKRLIAIVCPFIVFTYTVKPNIYGSIAARDAHIPVVANITGLGTAVNGKGLKAAFVLFLYKIALRSSQKVFFQNEANKKFMVKNKIVSSPYMVLPGSGVNLVRHCFEPYPENNGTIIFTTVGRIMKDKGTDELLEAAREAVKHYPGVKFRLIGFFDSDYEKKIRAAETEGIIEYIGQQRDIHSWLKESHAIIHPSYHEGMSNVLLEAAATGRPVLASDIPGCRETFDDKSGIGFKPQSSKDLIRAIETFLDLPYDKKAAMGRAGREKMEKEFDRRFVVEKYMDEIKKVIAEAV